MRWLRITLQRLLRVEPPRIVCEERVWADGVADLERRTQKHTRESGAFLLGVRCGEQLQIREFVFYDDIDPAALNTGIVHFHGAKFEALWNLCAEKKLQVVADVHVHPFGYEQSESDRAYPAIPRAGHIAFILPNFARGPKHPGGIGQFEYRGNGAWMDQTKRGSRFFKVLK
ncbi:hypothetical protein [Roseiterribacter gracilis]|uniref:JAB domain-containing protein n=1 Tax=Roseiterribacter gracilis TaxID=2812848 RepID=A0A8S8XCY4_9PROT|nr:hypothetical protein TMPK1_27910 [Rhodospirillales bacterium TMPK1]